MNFTYQALSTTIFVILLTACGPQATQPAAVPATTTPVIEPPTQTVVVPTVSSTETPEATLSPETPSSVSFSNDVLPIFNNSCVKCHGTEEIKKGLDLRAYDSLMAGSFNGSVLTPGNAADSLLIQQLLNGKMPKRGQKLSTEQIQIISDWVNAGALNN
ncbi:MAG: c-type cytochrome [Chloroflexi bacterium]|nr:c-type cytochrome [Chloroflexota bacterium]